MPTILWNFIISTITRSTIRNSGVRSTIRIPEYYTMGSTIALKVRYIIQVGSTMAFGSTMDSDHWSTIRY